MDSALDKVGLYDFFGVFLSGMLVVVVSCYLGLPLMNSIENIDNDIVNTILFMVESYFGGVILQEISSAIDKKLFKFREKARCNFLNVSAGIVSNKLELDSFRKLANKILNKANDDKTYSEAENEYVYFVCKTFLETYGKSDKVNRINSLYAMCRSLMISIPLCLVAYFSCNMKSFNIHNFIVTVILIIVTGIFYRRTKRFSTYKVRVILRYYEMLSKKMYK